MFPCVPRLSVCTAETFSTFWFQHVSRVGLSDCLVDLRAIALHGNRSNYEKYKVLWTSSDMIILSLFRVTLIEREYVHTYAHLSPLFIFRSHLSLFLAFLTSPLVLTITFSLPSLTPFLFPPHFLFHYIFINFSHSRSGMWQKSPT